MYSLLYIEDIGGLVKFAFLAAAIAVLTSIAFLHRILKKSKHRTVAIIIICIAVFFLTTWLVLNGMIDNQ